MDCDYNAQASFKCYLPIYLTQIIDLIQYKPGYSDRNWLFPT